MTTAGVPVARSRVFDGWFVVGAVSVVLLGYLLVAMLVPEKLS